MNREEEFTLQPGNPALKKNVSVGGSNSFDSSCFSGDATLDRAVRRKSESAGGTRHWPEAGAGHQGPVP